MICKVALCEWREVRDENVGGRLGCGDGAGELKDAGVVVGGRGKAVDYEDGAGGGGERGGWGGDYVGFKGMGGEDYGGGAEVEGDGDGEV